MKLLRLILLALLLQSCDTSGLFQQRGETGVQAAKVLADEDGILTAAIGAGQQAYVTGSAADGLDSAKITFFSDSLAFDTKVTVEQGDSLISSSDADALGVAGASAGSTLVISSSIEQNPDNPYAIEIEADATSLALAQRIIMVYKIWDFTNERMLFGFIDTKDLEIKGLVVRAMVSFFGAFELVYITETPSSQEIVTNKPIVSKTSKKSADPPQSVLLSGLPGAGTSADDTEVTVEGEKVTEFKFYLGLKKACGKYSKWFDPKNPLKLQHKKEGKYLLCVIGRNESGVDQINATTAAFTVDRTGPEIGVSGSVSTNSQFTADADTKDAQAWLWKQVSGPGNISFGSPNKEVTTIEADADGTYTISITAADAVGNKTTRNLTLEWDETSPPALSAFNAIEGEIPGSTRLGLGFPSNVSDYDRVRIWRSTPTASTGNAIPDCGSGEKVYDSEGPFTDTSFSDEIGEDSKYVSYRVCIRDKVGNLTSSNTDADTQTKTIPELIAGFVAYDIDGDGTENSGNIGGTTSSQWNDITGSSRDLSLLSFNNDSTSGWQGDGSVGDPYRLRFDGTNDMAKYATTDVTWKSVTAWFRYLNAPGYNSGTYLVALGTNYRCVVASEAMRCIRSGTEWLGTGATANEWHFMTINYTGTKVEYYLDGVEFAETNASFPPTSNIAVGARDTGSDFLDGEIAEVMVYSESLDYNTVQHLYQSTRARYQSPPANPWVERFKDVLQVPGSLTTVTAIGHQLDQVKKIQIDGNALTAPFYSGFWGFSGTPANLAAGTYDLKVTFANSTKNYTDLVQYIAAGPILAYFDANNIDSIGGGGSGSTKKMWRSLIGGRTGALHGATLQGDGSSSSPRHIDLDGSDDYISFGNNLGVAYSVWFRPDVANTGYVISLKNTANYIIHAQLYTGDRVAFKYSTSGITQYSATSSIDAGDWAHIVITHDGSSALFYLNGSLVGSDVVPALTGSKFFTVGSFVTGGSLLFDGDIGDVHIFDQHVSSGQVSGLYSAGALKYTN